MLKRLVITAALPGLINVTGLPARAADGPQPIYQRMIERYPAPALKDLAGREFKFLVDPTKLPKDPEAAFRELWSRMEAAAARAGFAATAPAGKRAGKPFKIEASIKDYLDTPGQDLWKHGFILRVGTKVKKGEDNRTITVKAIHEDALRTLATPLIIAGAAATVESEGNVGLGRDGRLGEYIEKGATWEVRLDQLGALTLGDFWRFMPELLKLGLPPGTRLITTRAYAVKVKPGQLVLPGAGAFPVSMEAWSRTEGGEIVLLDLSYRSEGGYYQNATAHRAAERFMVEVLYRELKDLAGPDAGKWGGSKVRVLLNRPLPE